MDPRNDAEPMRRIMGDERARRVKLLADLRTALKAPDQLMLHYQPQVDLRSGRCSGVEVLLRWHHPEFGPVQPVEFIPFIETDFLMSQLTDWVLSKALEQAVCLQGLGLGVRLGINISALSLHVGYLAGRLAELFRQHSVSPSALELEFTEGALVFNVERARSQLLQIRRMGVSVAIDDFGTGYSNLAYLKSIPADKIKIDKSFVIDLQNDRKSRIIIRWLIGLAHELDLRVVAEGIETKEALTALTAWNCDEAQGYFLAHPMSGPELGVWLKNFIGILA